jgi:hypothetical protein
MMKRKMMKRSQWLSPLFLAVVTLVLFYGGETPGCGEKECSAVIRVTNNTTQEIEVTLFHNNQYLGSVKLNPGEAENVQATVIVHEESKNFEVTWSSQWMDPVVNVWADHKNGVIEAECGTITDLGVDQ